MKITTFFFLFVFLSFSAFAQVTFDWQSQTISPDNNLREMNIVNDTTTILVGYGKTFSKSADLGLTWDNVPILTPTFDFIDISINENGVGYACAEDERVINNPSGGEPDVYADGFLLKTSDNGLNWAHIDISTIGVGDDPVFNPSAPACYGRHFRSVEVLGDNTAFLGVEWYEYVSVTGARASHAAAFKTTDGGLTWIDITDNGKYPYGIEVADTSVYFGGSNHLFKAVDGSDVVTDIYPNLVTAAGGDATIFIFDFTIISEEEVYVVTSGNGMYKTTDRGASFLKLGGEGMPTGGNDMYVVNDTVMLILGTSTKSKVTLDGGLNWAGCYPGATCYEIGGVLNDSLYGLGKSSIHKIAVADLLDSVFTWTPKQLNDGSNLQKMQIIDADNAIIVGYGGTFKETTDAGLTWNQADLPELFVSGADYDFSDVSTSGEVSFASTRRHQMIDLPSSSVYPDFYARGLLYKSMDYWNTWDLLDVGDIGDALSTDPALNPHLDGCYGLSPTELECVNDTIVYLYANWVDTTAGADNRDEHSYVFKTIDGGDSWAPITEDFGSSNVTSIQFITKDIGFITGNTLFLQTIDGGASFIDLYPAIYAADDSDSTKYLGGIHYIDENEYYVVSNLNGIFATQDAGTTFTMMDGIGGAYDFYKADPTTYVALGNSTKSKISWDTGATWTDIYPGSSVWDIGGVLNDSLVGLAKSVLYKIALTNLEAPSTETDILTFVLDEQDSDAVIDANGYTIAIDVPEGTDVTALSPTITISDFAKVAPASEVAQNFTDPVTYTVTAQDGNTTQDWVVTVTVLVGIPENLVGDITMYPNPVKDMIYLKNLDNVERITIYSIVGESILNLEPENSDMEIDMGVLEEGIYFISFDVEEGERLTKKFVKM